MLPPLRTSVCTFALRMRRSAPSGCRRFSDKEKTGSEKDRLTQILIRAIDAKPREEPTPSKEEAGRRHEIGRNYVIGNFKRHNEVNHDMACKIRLKNHAIEMLPKDSMIREEALKISMDDESCPPISRLIPMETPPNPGFKASDFGSGND